MTVPLKVNVSPSDPEPSRFHSCRFAHISLREYDPQVTSLVSSHLQFVSAIVELSHGVGWVKTVGLNLATKASRWVWMTDIQRNVPRTRQSTAVARAHRPLHRWYGLVFGHLCRVACFSLNMFDPCKRFACPTDGLQRAPPPYILIAVVFTDASQSHK